MPVSDMVYNTYLRDDTRGCEGEDRVLHATVRETGGQDQNIILSPSIRVDNFLHRSAIAVQRR